MKESIEYMLEEFSQTVSYQFGDLVMSYPEALRSMALAVMQNCITAQLQIAPKAERELFDILRERMTITMMPASMDPRKFGGEKNED